MDLSLLLVYMFSVFMLLVTPGPVVALVISTSLVSGPRQAMLTALGSNWASLVLVMVAALILTGALSFSGVMLAWVSLGGCCFMAYLALQTLRHVARHAAEGPGVAVEPKRPRSGVLSGFLVGISNPKDIIFFVSFFPQFIAVTPSFQGSLAILSGLWIVLDLSMLCAYALLMRQPLAMKYKRLIEFISGIALLLISMGGLFHSIRTLSGL